MERTTETVCYRHPDRPTRLSCSECGRPICVECAIDAPVGQKCPECAAHVGRGRVVTARQMRGATLVTRAILIVTVGMFFLQLATPGPEIEQQLAQINALVERGELWRLATAALLHANLMHIGFNMYALWIFGPNLERQVGGAAFFALYLACALAGGAAFLLVGRGGSAIGASGAIFGLFGAWIAASWRIRHTATGAAQFRQLVVLLGINLALPLFYPGIAWEAHVGGLAAGAAIATIWLLISARRPRARIERTAVAATVGLLALIVAVLL